MVGNGGFSLRDVRAMLAVTDAMGVNLNLNLNININLAQGVGSQQPQRAGSGLDANPNAILDHIDRDVRPYHRVKDLIRAARERLARGYRAQGFFSSSGGTSNSSGSSSSNGSSSGSSGSDALPSYSFDYVRTGVSIQLLNPSAVSGGTLYLFFYNTHTHIHTHINMYNIHTYTQTHIN